MSEFSANGKFNSLELVLEVSFALKSYGFSHYVGNPLEVFSSTKRSPIWFQIFCVPKVATAMSIQRLFRWREQMKRGEKTHVLRTSRSQNRLFTMESQIGPRGTSWVAIIFLF